MRCHINLVLFHQHIVPRLLRHGTHRLAFRHGFLTEPTHFPANIDLRDEQYGFVQHRNRRLWIVRQSLVRIRSHVRFGPLNDFRIGLPRLLHDRVKVPRCPLRIRHGILR